MLGRNTLGALVGALSAGGGGGRSITALTFDLDAAREILGFSLTLELLGANLLLSLIVHLIEGHLLKKFGIGVAVLLLGVAVDALARLLLVILDVKLILVDILDGDGSLSVLEFERNLLALSRKNSNADALLRDCCC